MIAIQTTSNNQSIDSNRDSNRAPGASRGSLPSHPNESTDQSADAKASAPPPSLVADGGGAESSRRRGSSYDVQATKNSTQPTNPPHYPAPQPTPQPYKLPDHIIESNLLDALLDGSFDLPDLCIHFKLDPHELLAYLKSPQTNQLLNTLAKIADIRANMIASQAQVAATHRLSELARHGHITDSPRQARANETARKAAAQLLRNSKTRVACPSMKIWCLSSSWIGNPIHLSELGPGLD